MCLISNHILAHPTCSHSVFICYNPKLNAKPSNYALQFMVSHFHHKENLPREKRLCLLLKALLPVREIPKGVKIILAAKVHIEE